MSKNDVTIKALMAKVEAQKKDLGTRERVSWLTNGMFKRDSDNYFNLNTVVDGFRLAEALGFLIIENEGFNEACKRLNVAAKFKWDGYTVDEWQTDFQTRMRVVNWDKKKKQLEATKSKLGSLVSEEARTEMELEEIASLLGE